MCNFHSPSPESLHSVEFVAGNFSSERERCIDRLNWKMRTCGAECIIEVTLLSLVWCAAVGLNLITLLAFYRKRTLRSSGHRFLLSLTLSNLAIALLLLPPFLYQTILQIPHPGMLFAALTAYLVGVSVFNVLLIGWDRFLACARNPLFYNRNMSYRRSVVLIGVSWFLPAAILAPAVVCQQHSATGSDASVILWRSSNTTLTTALIFSLGNYFLPLFALTAIYTKVFCAAKSSTSSQGRRNLVFEFDRTFTSRRSLTTTDMSKTCSTTGVATKPGGGPFSRQNSSSSFQSFLSGQERQKAAHIIIWILVTFVGLYSPYFCQIIIEAFFPVDTVIPATFQLAVHVLYFLGTVLNPVIYILCNSGLRRDIRRVFMRKDEIRRQSSLMLQGTVQRIHSHLWLSGASDSKCFSGVGMNRQASVEVSCSTQQKPSIVLPLITCTSPDGLQMLGNSDDDVAEDELYFPDGGRFTAPRPRPRLSLQLTVLEDTSDVSPTEDQSPRGLPSLGSSRSLNSSRKSVSFVEEACFFDRPDDDAAAGLVSSN